jgi:hypothetical protein
MRIALFATCIGDSLFPRVAIATLQLLERLGREVAFPKGQTCCGQMHVNTGYLAEAAGGSPSYRRLRGSRLRRLWRSRGRASGRCSGAGVPAMLFGGKGFRGCGRRSGCGWMGRGTVPWMLADELNVADAAGAKATLEALHIVVGLAVVIALPALTSVLRLTQSDNWSRGAVDAAVNRSRTMESLGQRHDGVV